MSAPRSPNESMRAAWRRLSPLPGGKALFSRLIGRFVPYSGSIKPRVLELRAGYARVQLRDRRSLRNHLGSVHAIALVNLGELASGLAMTMALPPEIRGIVTSLSVEYVKKARGLITAECETPVPEVGDVRVTHQVRAVIRDSGTDEVARVTVNWLLDRRPSSRDA